MKIRDIFKRTLAAGLVAIAILQSTIVAFGYNNSYIDQLGTNQAWGSLLTDSNFVEGDRNDWLKEYEYSYKIGKEDLEEYSNYDYRYGAVHQDVIELDMETIYKINQEYKQDKVVQNTYIDKILILIGAVLVGYSLLRLFVWRSKALDKVDGRE